MTEGQKLLVDACKLENMPHYIASDYCLDFTKLKYCQNPAKDPMKHVKAHLETNKSVQGVHVLIGTFTETFWSGYLWTSTIYGTTAEYVAAVALDRNVIGMQHFLGDRSPITLPRSMGRSLTLSAWDRCKIFTTPCTQHPRMIDPRNIFACLAIKTHLMKDLDNFKYPQVKPIHVQGLRAASQDGGLGRLLSTRDIRRSNQTRDNYYLAGKANYFPS
ncbi:hypothetical protein ABOM_003495 [Aspergillus bombycis]|uniref:Uncharacterized protein n=1 Tax=Aspergillus bombycis TaxID=109264 RepID=A0A1F8ACF1_9EURO|nr:hypothetical protein ABOM_003495 [Aspergillus bombycis]OGM49420.1 hypothetical protein ABOM_003495 [Aspergillus bombycis]